MLCTSGQASADRIDTLVTALRGDPSFKVRVQAAFTLGKIRDKKAVPALVQALKQDANHTVRAAAASALGTIGDKKAEDGLATAASVDKESLVRNEARKALSKLSSGGGGGTSSSGGGGGKVFISLGNMGNAAGTGGQALTKVLKEAFRKELGTNSQVTFSQSGGGKAFYVDGSITKLAKSNAGGQVELTCEVRLVVATYPQKSIVMMTSGGATVQADARGFNAGVERSLQVDAIENAVKGVHQNFVSFLARQ